MIWAGLSARWANSIRNGFSIMIRPMIPAGFIAYGSVSLKGQRNSFSLGTGKLSHDVVYNDFSFAALMASRRAAAAAV